MSNFFSATIFNLIYIPYDCLRVEHKCMIIFSFFKYINFNAAFGIMDVFRRTFKNSLPVTIFKLLNAFELIKLVKYTPELNNDGLLLLK